MKKIVLLAAAAASTTSLAAITSNSLEIRTSLTSNDADTDDDPTLGFSLDRAMWLQDGKITDTGFGYHFEVNFNNGVNGLTPRHVDASYTHGMHTFTAGMRDNKVGGAEYAFQPEIERALYMGLLFNTWDSLNIKLPGFYYTLAGDAWGSFTVGAHDDNGANAAVDKLSYFTEFRGSFLEASLKPIVQYQQFNKVNGDRDFKNSYLSAGIIWDAKFGLDLGFTYNANINEAITDVGSDTESTEFVVNVLYEIKGFRPYFNWGQTTTETENLEVVATRMDLGLLYDLHDQVSLQFDYNTAETDVDESPKPTQWSIGLNAVVM